MSACTKPLLYRPSCAPQFYEGKSCTGSEARLDAPSCNTLSPGFTNCTATLPYRTDVGIVCPQYVERECGGAHPQSDLQPGGWAKLGGGGVCGLCTNSSGPCQPAAAFPPPA